MLVLAAIGLGSGAWQLARRKARPRSLVLAVLAIWLLLPLALFAVMRPERLRRHAALPVYRAGTGCLVGHRCRVALADVRSAAGPHLAGRRDGCRTDIASRHSLVRLHPFQYTYFNCLAGGVAGAAGKYETDYWLTSYKEAIEWIEAQPPVRWTASRICVLVAANENSRWCAAYFASDRLAIETTLTAGQSGDCRRGSTTTSGPAGQGWTRISLRPKSFSRSAAKGRSSRPSKDRGTDVLELRKAASQAILGLPARPVPNVR